MPSNVESFGERAASAIVHIRVRPQAAGEIAHACGLPAEVPGADVGESLKLALAPGEWLLISDTVAASRMVSTLRPAMTGVAGAAFDVSAAYRRYRVSIATARGWLASAAGLDTGACFEAGFCTRTRFADIEVIVVVTNGDEVEFIVDRTLAAYFERWLEAHGGRSGADGVFERWTSSARRMRRASP